MSRRRRPWYLRLLRSASAMLAGAWYWLRSVLLFPLYVVREIQYAVTSWFFAGMEGRSFGGALLHHLLLIPRLAWHYVVVAAIALFQMVLSWPRLMRLRDLAAGLPALLAGVAAVLILFVLHKSRQEVLNSYQEAVQDVAKTASEEKDPEKQKTTYERVLLYLRALSKLNESETQYRFDVARVYYMLGEINRGQAIMQSLAPRYAAGFAPAHIWQAERLIRQMPSDQAFDDAVAHLTWALERTNDPSRVHRLLGELYFRAYTQYRPQQYDPHRPSRTELLEKAEKHLSAVGAGDPAVAMMLGKLHAWAGKPDVAMRDISLVVGNYKAVLARDAGNTDVRIELARAYRDINNFLDAVKELNDGRRQRPDPRYEVELSATYFFMSLYLQQNLPNSLGQQYGALRAAYLSYPPNPFVAARLIQGLGGSAEEAREARAMLQDVLKSPGSHAMANFLLGFDASRRSLVAQSEEYFAAARTATEDEKVPYSLADIALASLQRRSQMVDSATAGRLNQAALRVWPTNPGLLMVRGWTELQTKNYAVALSYLTKALERRENDATLHSMLQLAYQGLGQAANAEKHRRLAEALHARTAALEGAEAPVIVPPK